MLQKQNFYRFNNYLNQLLYCYVKAKCPTIALFIRNAMKGTQSDLYYDLLDLKGKVRQLFEI